MDGNFHGRASAVDINGSNEFYFSGDDPVVVQRLCDSSKAGKR